MYTRFENDQNVDPFEVLLEIRQLIRVSSKISFNEI